MYKIKRKLIIAITAAFAVLLSGCSNGSESVPAFSENISAGTSAEMSSISDAPDDPDTSEPDDPDDPDDPDPEPIPVVPLDLSEAEKTGTYLFSKNPAEPVTVTFKDDSITVKMKGRTFVGVQGKYPEMKIKRSFDGEFSVFTLTRASGGSENGFGTFYLIDKNNYLGEVQFALSDGKIAAPELRPLAENNQSVLENITNSSEERIAQAITLDGSRDKIPQIWSEIEKISNEICSGIDDDYEKLRAIAGWVSENIYYDRPAVSRGEPPSCLTLEYMLNNRSSICGGYANMTAALCQAQGIRCISIVGKALIDGQNYLNTSLAGGLHEWNVAEIDGRQIIVDSCWMSSNNLGYDGRYHSKNNSWKYFDTGDEIFAVDHQADTAEYKDFKSLVP